MPRDAVSRTANVGTMGKNGLMLANDLQIVRLFVARGKATYRRHFVSSLFFITDGFFLLQQK